MDGDWFCEISSILYINIMQHFPVYKTKFFLGHYIQILLRIHWVHSGDVNSSA